MTLVTLVTRNRALEREFLELLDSLTLKFLVSKLHRLAIPWFSFTTSFFRCIGHPSCLSRVSLSLKAFF